MNIYKNNLYAFLILLLTLTFSCSAPRENPFDPGASNYQGKVKTIITVNRLFSPNVGIGNVRITSDELHLSELTDSFGRVVWNHDFIDSIKIFIEKDGFFSDTTTFALQADQNEFTVFLNAKPQLLESGFISLYSPSTSTNLELKVKIYDEDGINDFTTAYLKQADFNFIDTLAIEKQIDEFTKEYRTLFNKNKLSSQLGDQSIPEIDFQLILQNSTGDYLIFEPFSIRRVISEKLVLNTPNFSQRISGNIEFSWDKIDVNYFHQYKISLYQFITLGLTILIDEFGPVSSNENRYIISDSNVLNNLSSGEYLWILWVEDQIGNICVSNGMRFSYIK